MTYIINPWFFYLSNLFDNLGTVSVCIFVIAIFGTLLFAGILLYMRCDEYDEYYEHDDNKPLIKFLKKMLKISIIITIVSATLMTFIPSEETINKMIISSFITKENIEGVKTDAKELVDYVVEKAAELKTTE